MQGVGGAAASLGGLLEDFGAISSAEVGDLLGVLAELGSPGGIGAVAQNV